MTVAVVLGMVSLCFVAVNGVACLSTLDEHAKYFVAVGGGGSKSCGVFTALPAGVADFGDANDRVKRGILFEDQYDEGAAKRLAMFSAMTYCPLSSAVSVGATMGAAQRKTGREVQNLANAAPTPNKMQSIIAKGQCAICNFMGDDFILIGTFGQQDALDGQSSVNNADNAYGLVGIYRNTRHMVFAFRGTQGPNVPNWKANLRIGVGSKLSFGTTWDAHNQSPTDRKIMVHKGFQDALNHIWPAMSAAALGYATQYCDGIEGVNRISFTGHSLGGGIAMLAATKFLAENSGPTSPLRQRTEVYTFGQPKVGNHHFVCKANSLIRRIYRIRNAGDCVWKLPPGMKSPGDAIDFQDASVPNASFDINGFVGDFAAYSLDYSTTQSNLPDTARSESVKALPVSPCRAESLIGNRPPRVLAPPGALPPLPVVAPPPAPVPGQWVSAKAGVRS